MCNLKTTFTIKVTNEDIDDIMATALEGGITYWCNKAKVEGKYLGEYASEQISRGGVLKLYPIDEDLIYTLTKEKLLKGIQQAIEESYLSEYNWWNRNGIDTGNVDADVSDIIIQLALFGDIIYR